MSTSDTIVAQFTPAGEISRVVQEGNFRFKEGQVQKANRAGAPASAERAIYSSLDDSLTLQGNPRIVDGGTTVTADSIRLLRRSGEAVCPGQREELPTAN